MQLIDPVRGSSSPLMSRSILGLVAYWNRLPADVIFASSVKTFQSRITDLAKEAVSKGSSIDDLCALMFIHVPYGVERHS